MMQMPLRKINEETHISEMQTDYGEKSKNQLVVYKLDTGFLEGLLK